MISFEEVFARKYPKTHKRIIEIYEEANGHKPEFATISKPELSVFVDTLCDKVCGSSAKTYTAQIKAVINLYEEECPQLAKGWDKVLSVKNDVSEQIYLTDEELSRVIAFSPDTPTEATVHQQFILACLVGARHGDIIKLTEKNIRNGYICYVSEKTHIKAMTPISSVSERILTGRFRNKADTLFADDNYEYMAYKNKVSDTTFNETLRNICKLCDIDEEITLYKRGQYITAPKWKFASGHLGRRTAATLLYIHGCDIYSISRILAHASVEMTAQKYILCPLRQLSDETMSYFSQFK